MAKYFVVQTVFEVNTENKSFTVNDSRCCQSLQFGVPILLFYRQR